VRRGRLLAALRQVLYYYIKQSDPVPRGTFFVENCAVEAEGSKVSGVKAGPGEANAT